jgi:WD40 repeat protein
LWVVYIHEKVFFQLTLLIVKNASEKPFLDLTLTNTGITLAASTDRTITLYDLRTSTLTSSTGVLAHPSTPSCVVVSPTAEHQAASGAYDGVVRVWDLRGAKAPVATFKAAEGGKKVLALGWERGMIVAGGEAGLEVWKAGDGNVDAWSTRFKHTQVYEHAKTKIDALDPTESYYNIWSQVKKYE